LAIFYAKMEKAGKIFIPKTILALWQNEDTAGCITDLTVEPT